LGHILPPFYAQIRRKPAVEDGLLEIFDTVLLKLCRSFVSSPDVHVSDLLTAACIAWAMSDDAPMMTSAVSNYEQEP
jgi:hypothetical protein